MNWDGAPRQNGVRHLAGLGLVGVVMLGLVGGCYKEPVAITTYPPTDSPVTQTTPPPGQTQGPDEPGASGAPSADCVDGWSSPEAGSAELEEGLEALDRQLEPEAGLWQVDDVRQFTGPDVPWGETPAENVTRWYLRVSLATDPNFRGRFLIERRSDLNARVVAVAPYDSRGFTSPDWTGFYGAGQPTPYLGLPGQWSGTPYDFVSGGGYSGQPGLPDQVVGCLSDT
jgi:hypothetical protein